MVWKVQGSLAASTNRQPNQAAARRRSQRIDNVTQGQGGRQGGGAEDPQQDHAQYHSENASDDERPLIHGVGHAADQGLGPEADNMQKQTQTYAEKVRQDWKGHTRGPPFVWAYLGLVKSLQQRGSAVGARTGTGQSDLLGPTGAALTNSIMRCRANTSNAWPLRSPR